jgi:hypothetical protein
MRAALAKARRARVLGRSAATLDPAYAKALAARESAERTSAWLVLIILLVFVGGRRAQPPPRVCSASGRADQGRAWLPAPACCTGCVRAMTCQRQNAFPA